MPLKTDFNVAPYFDDYDETKNYHRVLFRPSTAVQARELTQLQTILQNQIERFGNWAFRNGDIVSGCTIYNMPLVPYVRLMDFASNGSANVSPLDVRDYINAIATSVTTGLKAQVLYANAGFSTNYPDNNILYLKYLNTGENGAAQFTNAELLTFEMVTPEGNIPLSNVYTWANTRTNTVCTGNAYGISVSEGIIYINGNFVRVANSTFGLVNNFGTYAGNNVVGFDLIEEIINENQDESLLDNALGYSNENAPGAHRLKLTPTIVSLTPEEASVREGFNPIATFNYGSLVTKTVVSSNVYSIIGDIMAKRTYEESGNYVVNPFVIDTVTNVPGSQVAPETANNVLGRISPGVGYAQGSRVEILKTAYIQMRRGIDTQVNKSQEISFNYGGYFILNEVAGSFPTNSAQVVKLYNKAQKTITNRTFASVTSPTGTQIGTAYMRCFTYYSGSPGTKTAQYILHIFNVQINPGYTLNQVASVFYDGTIKGVADVVSTGLVDSQLKSQLYSFGVRGLKNLRDAGGNISTDYVYRTTNTTAVMTTGGDITVIAPSSAPGGFDILPYGIGEQTDSTGTEVTVIAAANVDSSALSGTVAISSTNTTVTGTSTTFSTNFLVGEQIKVGSDIRTIVSITNATSMSVDANFGSTLSGQTYYKSYLKGKIIPFSRTVFGPSGRLTVDNNTQFTVHTGQFPGSSLPVHVTYNVKRSVASPAKKEIKKNRFVKINTASNPKGPWCLGVSDIHKVTKIYGGASGSYTTSGVDLTTSFTYDTGQNDTHYGLAYLYPKAGYSSTSYPSLLVQLDYFTANTSSGLGFFTVESYPVDDANTANTNAIQTKDIPLYISESGDKFALRDVIDFRTPCVPTATDTGNIDIANSSQVTTAIAAASLNPSATLTLSVPVTGLNFPAYGKGLESDYTMYLGRKDVVLITPDNTIKVKEGLAGVSPQAPLYPENSMALAILNIPPYPSLSSDQVDDFLAINQNSRNLIRDTSTAISASLVTNRRYTMKDIGTLDQRITNIEYYTQLSLLEKKAKDLTITDSNGLDRFKNGIFVDPFTDYSLGEVSNPEYSVAIDTVKGVARPRIVREVINVKFNNIDSSNVAITGRLVTLSYTENKFLEQPFATKYRSAALVAFAWNGQLTLIPPIDNNVDQNNTGSINVTIDNTTPWKDFAASPFGTVWGDWRTTTTVASNTVITGTVFNEVRNSRGQVISRTPATSQPVGSSSIVVNPTTTVSLGTLIRGNRVVLP